jgi:hypothetical protein
MKSLIAIFGFLTVASGVFAQQTTSTNCNVNGQNINCTSTSPTVTAPAPLAPNFAAGGAGIGTGIGALVAAHRAKKAAKEQRAAAQSAQAAEDARIKDSAIVNTVYCKQNPQSTFISREGGQQMSCADGIARVKAYCTVHPDGYLCPYVKDAQ